MERHGYITSEERAMAASIPIESLLDKSDMSGSEYQGYLDTVTAEIKKKYSSIKPTLEKMRKLYEILLKKSKDRGAIDFDADEAVILIGEDGAPSDIIRRERGVSERIIEQFMLTANEAVATYLTNRGIPCVYRIHETPPPEGFAGFIDYLESLGFDVRKLRKTEPTPKILSEILEIAEEKGLSDAVSYTMLRAMAKAKYSEVRQSHFGLGIENYCHFTSPIRRYPDLFIHRVMSDVEQIAAQEKTMNAPDRYSSSHIPIPEAPSALRFPDDTPAVCRPTDTACCSGTALLSHCH